jgi:hypothetical protein
LTVLYSNPCLLVRIAALSPKCHLLVIGQPSQLQLRIATQTTALCTPLHRPQCASRLPVLPEHSVEQGSPSCSSSIIDMFVSAIFSVRPCRSDASTSCSSSVTHQLLFISPISLREAPQSLRQRRIYNRPQFLARSSSRRVQSRAHQAKTPNCASEGIRHRHRHHQSTSPVNDVSTLAEPSSSAMTTPPRPTRPRDQRPKSPRRPRTRSPTPSLTSMSACSSNDIPTTPLTSDDDEWPGLNLSPNCSPQLQLRRAPRRNSSRSTRS